MSSISSVSSSYLQQILNSVQNSGMTAQTSGTQEIGTQSDNGKLSPFAQLMSTLQQLQQSDPAQYKAVTSQIATNLTNAAQTAKADGNTTAATQLTQLASDFSDASKSGNLPNISDVAKAMGGHGHHHMHHVAASSSDSSSGSSTDSNTDSNASSTLSQLIAAFQSNSTGTDSFDPVSIIMNTLSSAGVSVSGS